MKIGAVKRPPPAQGSKASLRAEFKHAPDGMQLITLSGSIDENADLSSVFSQMTGDVILNLEHIERVNSMGVHRWIPLVASFTAKHKLVIEGMSYPLVQNANVVANLFATAF